MSPGAHAFTGVVVVGYDGTPPARAALLWAGRFASRIGAELVVALAGTVLSDVERSAGTPDEGGATLAKTRRILAGEGVTCRLRTVLRDEEPARLLTSLGRDGDVLVLGVEAGGGLTGRVRGVTGAVLEHAQCPVVLVPAEAPPPGTRPVVLAAVPAHAGALPVLQTAAHYAETSGTGVLAVHARRRWRTEDAGLQDLVAHLRNRYTRVPIELRIVDGSVPSAVRSLASTADLVVVGTHRARRRRLASRLGRTARRTVYGLPVPVAVVGDGYVLPRTHASPHDAAAAP